jgi:hypothetical protein
MGTFENPNNPNAFASPAKDRIHRASTGAHNAIDKAAGAVRPAVESMASGAHRTVDAVAGAASRAKEAIGGKAERLMNAEAQLVESSRAYVRDNPITSLTIALGVGYALSRLLQSR